MMMKPEELFNSLILLSFFFLGGVLNGNSSIHMIPLIIQQGTLIMLMVIKIGLN